MSDSTSDPLAMLDFQPTLSCEFKGQPYLKPVMTPLGVSGEGLAGIPTKGPCSNPAEFIVDQRVCPCWHDVKKSMDLRHKAIMEHRYEDAQVVIAGLFVFRLSSCAKHVEYYRDFLEYPFQCPGCGVRYLHPGEMIIKTTAL